MQPTIKPSVLFEEIHPTSSSVKALAGVAATFHAGAHIWPPRSVAEWNKDFALTTGDWGSGPTFPPKGQLVSLRGPRYLTNVTKLCYKIITSYIS